MENLTLLLDAPEPGNGLGSVAQCLPACLAPVSRPGALSGLAQVKREDITFAVGASGAVAVEAIACTVLAVSAHQACAWDQPVHAGASLAGNDSSDASDTASS